MRMGLCLGRVKAEGGEGRGESGEGRWWGLIWNIHMDGVVERGGHAVGGMIAYFAVWKSVVGHLNVGEKCIRRYRHGNDLRPRV